MPSVDVKDPVSGKSATIQYDGEPPTADDLEKIFGPVPTPTPSTDQGATGATGGGALPTYPGTPYTAMSPNERHAADLLSGAAGTFDSVQEPFLQSEGAASFAKGPAPILPKAQWGIPGTPIVNDANHLGGVVSRPVVNGITVATFGNGGPKRYYGVNGEPLPAGDPRAAAAIGAPHPNMQASDIPQAFREVAPTAVDEGLAGMAQDVGTLAGMGMQGSTLGAIAPGLVPKLSKGVGNVAAGIGGLPFQAAQAATNFTLQDVDPSASRANQEFAQSNVNAIGAGPGGPLAKLKAGDIKGGVKQLVQSAEEHPVEWAAAIIPGLIHGGLRGSVGLRDGLLDRANELDQTAEGADAATATALHQRADTLRGQAQKVQAALPPNAVPPKRSLVSTPVSKRTATAFPDEAPALVEPVSTSVSPPDTSTLTGLAENRADLAKSADAGQAVRDMESAAEGGDAMTPKPALTNVHNRQEFRDAVQQHFGYTDEQTEAAMAVADGHARLFEAKTGKPAADWYKENIGAVGKGYDGDGLNQAAGEAPTFYSQAERVVQANPQKSMRADQWQGFLNSRGVKPDEMKWTGLNDFLDEKAGQQVSKADVLEHLAGNKVELNEIVKGNNWSGLYNSGEEYSDAFHKAQDAGEWNKAADIQEDWDLFRAQHPDTKYGSYQFPGGKNYREMLLQLPSKLEHPAIAKMRDRLQELSDRDEGYGSNKTPLNDAEHAELNDIAYRLSSQPNPYINGDAERNVYSSTHWDEPNVLAHIRMSDRTGPKGEKVLHVEEVQSDWHQEGRKSGYDTTDPTKPWEAFNAKDGSVAGQFTTEGEARSHAESLSGNGEYYDYDNVRHSTGGAKLKPPAAPFSKTWHELAAKKILDYASRNGYDEVAWTPGEEQGKRYSEDNGGPKDQARTAGMKGFYDKILPDTFNKLGKRFGAKVGETNFNLGRNDAPAAIEIGRMRNPQTGNYEGAFIINSRTGEAMEGPFENANAAEARWQEILDEHRKDKLTPLHSLPITADMRRSLTTEGQALFDQRQGQNKGSVNFRADGKAIIRALDNPDASTVPHELWHVIRRSIFRDKLLSQEDLDYIEQWAGVKDGNWTPMGADGKLDAVHEEKWARAGERFLSEGKADWAPEPLQRAFALFKQWMQDIYNGIKGSAIDVELTPQIREIFAKTLGKGLDEPAVKPNLHAAEEVAPAAPKPDMIASINPEYTGLDAEGNKAVQASADRTGTQKRFVSWDSRRKSARDMDLQIERLKDTEKWPIDQLPVDKDGNHVNANDYVLNLRNLLKHYGDLDTKTFRDYQEALRYEDPKAPELLAANKDAQAALDAIPPRLSYFVGEKGRGLNEQKIIPEGYAPTEAARLREDLNAAPSIEDITETPPLKKQVTGAPKPRKTQNRSAKKVYTQEDLEAARDSYRSRKEGPALAQSSNPQTETPEFRNWFGESKVVDEQGKPMVVYHGTDSDFQQFKTRGYSGKNTDVNATSKEYAQTSRLGHWFSSSDPSKVGGYTSVIPSYLNIKNPYKIGLSGLRRGISFHGSASKLKASIIKSGYDGLEIDDPEFGGKSYVAFDPHQIKSAIGNRGTFDPSDANILHQDAEAPRLSEEDLADLTRMGAIHIENGAKDLPAFTNAIRGEEAALTDAQVQRIRANAQADLRDQVKKGNRKLASDVFTDQLAVKFGSRRAVANFLDAIDAADGSATILDKIIHGDSDDLTPAQVAILEKAYDDNRLKYSTKPTPPGALADVQKLLADTKTARSTAKPKGPPSKPYNLPLTPDKSYTQSIAARVGAQNVQRFNTELSAQPYGKSAMDKLRSGDTDLTNDEQTAIARAIIEARVKKTPGVGRDDIVKTLGQVVRDVQSGKLNYDDPVQRVRKLLNEIDPKNSDEHTQALAKIETDVSGKPTDQGYKDLLNYKKKVSEAVAKREHDALPSFERALTTVAEIGNAPRSIITSYDVSAPGRQGGFLMAANPVLGFKSFPDMFKALGSEKAADAVDYQIKSRENNANGYYKKSGLSLTSMDEHSGTLGKLSKHEEQYMSHLAEKIPGVRASERAYVTFLNKLRADNFDLLVNTIKASGREITDGDLKQIGTFINDATGRGSLGKFDSAGPLLSNLFFSPRFLMSRIRLSTGLPILGNYGGSAYARGLIARTYLQAGIGTAVVLGLLKLSGADVNTDRHSSNFLKATYKGHVVVDPMASFSQLWTFLSRIAPDWAGGGYTTTQAGQKVPLDGKGFHGTRASVTGRFLRSKASPAIGTGWDILDGKDYLGNPITPMGEISKNLIPMSWPDIVDAGKANGVPSGVMVGLGNMFGVGVNFQPPKKKTRPVRPMPGKRPERPVLTR